MYPPPGQFSVDTQQPACRQSAWTFAREAKAMTADRLVSAQGVLVRTDAAELDVETAGPAAGGNPWARGFEVTGNGTIVIDTCDGYGNVLQTALSIPATHITAGKRYDVNFTRIDASSTATGVIAYL